MKITYSNSYDRAAGYAVSISADANNLTVSMFYEASAVPDHGPHAVVDGENINSAWVGKKVVGYSTLTLDLNLVRAQPAWSDRSVWTGSGRFLPDMLLPINKHTKLWHNITAETVNNKVRPTDHFMRQLRTSPLDMGAFLLYVPFKDSDFDECALHVLSKIDGVPHLVNGVPLTGAETNPWQAQLDVMPRLHLSGPGTVAPDGKVMLDVQLLDGIGSPLARDCDVYFEAIGGYLPQPRTRLIGGKGTVRVMALGLETGESFKVKAGFRFWSGDADHVLEVK
jgi:hypothetical protein